MLTQLRRPNLPELIVSDVPKQLNAPSPVGKMKE
jgi:hypothetical protein